MRSGSRWGWGGLGLWTRLGEAGQPLLHLLGLTLLGLWERLLGQQGCPLLGHHATHHPIEQDRRCLDRGNVVLAVQHDPHQSVDRGLRDLLGA